MSTNYTRSKTGSYNISELQSQINSNIGIIPSCLGASASGTSLTMEFAADLSAGEEVVLTNIVDAHTPQPVDIDINTLPKSKLAGNPLAVHASYKPELEDGETYAVWSGAGDDMTDDVGGNGNGPLLLVVTETGVPQTTIDIEFNPLYGRVWLHEAYLKFANGGVGDTISSIILSYPVPLQQAAYLDLVLDGDWIKYSVSGPGTGTHGFADPTKIVLVDRAFQADGDWNYTETGGLTPNFEGTGRFKMSDKEQVVHRYVNRVPIYKDCATYFSMSSDETTELLPGYFARVVADNNSNTVWTCSILMELYREVTYSP